MTVIVNFSYNLKGEKKSDVKSFSIESENPQEQKQILEKIIFNQLDSLYPSEVSKVSINRIS